MNRYIVLVLCIIMLSLCTACQGGGTKETEMKPEIEQVRSICNLATLECYYHNVAKSVKTAGEGIAHLGEKERKFWIEYTGVAKIGIDMTKVTMEIDGNNVIVFIPDAQLLDISVEEKTLNEESYIASEDGLNSNKITAEDQTSAINNAQKEMEESVRNNSALLLTAQNRAKELIENYIKKLGESTGAEYSISWEYESNGSKPEVTATEEQ